MEISRAWENVRIYVYRRGFEPQENLGCTVQLLALSGGTLAVHSESNDVLIKEVSEPQFIIEQRVSGDKEVVRTSSTRERC